MESYLNQNFGGELPKNSSEDALQRWWKVCGFVKNHKRRFRFTANLSKRWEAAAMIQVPHFYTTFKESALRWFDELPVESITCFSQFKELFLTHHASVRRCLKSSPVLFDLDQGENESLKAYLARFHQETMKVRGLHPLVAMNALIRGLKQELFKYEGMQFFE